MKVLILYGSNDRYGASQVLISEIEALIELGHSVELMVPFDGPIEEMLIIRNLKVLITVNKKMPVMRHSKPLDFFKLKYGRDQIRNADITIIWTLAMVHYVPILLLHRRKFYISIHELAQSKALPILVKLFISPFKFPIQVNGKVVQEWLRTQGVKLDRIQISYPFFIDKTASKENKKNLESYGVLGRINGKKGHLEVAIAFNEQCVSHKSSLHLFGAPFPGQENELDRLLNFIECDERIHYHGEVEDFRKASRYITILLSFPLQKESLGLTPIEAYYQNIRVAGFSDGGSKEVFSLVDGIGIQRSGDILGDIKEFFAKYQNMDKINAWNPQHKKISSVFSKAERIEKVKYLIDKAKKID